MSRFLTNAAKPAAAVLFVALSVYGQSVLAQADSSSLNLETSQDQGSQCTEVEGSWLFKVSPVQAPSASWTAISSFAAGGVWLATGSDDHEVPASSELQGTWKSIGHHRYNSTSYFFSFDANNVATAMLKADQVFELKGPNKLVGSGKTSICDVAGKNCTSLPGSIEIHGTRIKLADPAELIELLPTE